MRIDVKSDADLTPGDCNRSLIGSHYCYGALLLGGISFAHVSCRDYLGFTFLNLKVVHAHTFKAKRL